MRRPFLAVLRAEVHESFLMAMSALAAHKLRSALTLVGVLVGVFSIIVVMTAIRVLQTNIESELSQLGTHTFSLQKHPVIHIAGRDGWEKIWRRKNLTFEQANALREKATLAAFVAVEKRVRQDAAVSRFAETDPEVTLLAVSPEAFAAKNWSVARGRAILPSDVDSARHVCVLGHSLDRKLFPFGSGLGEKVRFQGIHYTVVGVLEPRGKTLGGDQDNFLAIPISVGLGQFALRDRTLTILVGARNARHFEDTMEQTRGALRTIRKVPPGEPDDFELFTNDSLVAQFRAVTLAVRVGATVISSIALLAAGIGIMNIMLVSVTERTREIGIRRAVGAKKRNILTQFILEAVVICEVGGLAGIALGIAGGNAAAWLLKVPPVVPLDWAAIGLAICSLVGIVFGTYPALKAARLDPIESLRYE
ncbi:MAG: ABC transporter permease [Verrucomicrobia bacterium]|nr:ABC transporter permease [Verrucomicrobiota bacterium]